MTTDATNHATSGANSGAGAAAAGDETTDATDSAEPARTRPPGRAVRLMRRLNFFRRQSRPRQFFSWLVTAVAVVLLGCLVVLEVALHLDDHQIDTHQARATATVLTVGTLRTGIEFVDRTGATIRPPAGVMYPGLLSVGQQFMVEYSTDDPDVVRVAGRTAAVANVIVALAALIIALVTGALLLLIRRLPRISGPMVDRLAAGWAVVRRWVQEPESNSATSSATAGAETRSP